MKACAPIIFELVEAVAYVQVSFALVVPRKLIWRMTWRVVDSDTQEDLVRGSSLITRVRADSVMITFWRRRYVTARMPRQTAVVRRPARYRVVRGGNAHPVTKRVPWKVLSNEPLASTRGHYGSCEAARRRFAPGESRWVVSRELMNASDVVKMTVRADDYVLTRRLRVERSILVICNRAVLEKVSQVDEPGCRL